MSLWNRPILPLHDHQGDGAKTSHLNDLSSSLIDSETVMKCQDENQGRELWCTQMLVCVGNHWYWACYKYTKRTGALVISVTNDQFPCFYSNCNWLQIFLTLKPHCIRCSHFKVDDVSALEPSSKPPVRIVEDNVTASLHQQRTPWPWLRPGCRDDVTWIC
jgi:hypothetical protein